MMFDYDPNFGNMLYDFIKYKDSFNPATILIELTVYTIVALLFYHGYKKYGLKRILLYFTGGFILTVVEENFMVISGYDVTWVLHSAKTYYYNYHSYLFWIWAIPITVMLSWFILTYSSFHIAELVIPKDSKKYLLKRVLIAGMLGTTIDFVIDPIVIRRHGWIWLNDLSETFWFLQVPVTNFIGFFLLICSYNYFYIWYWERFIPKHENWGSVTGIIIFYLLIILPLLFTIISIIIIVILQAILGLNGIDLSWWKWLN